MVVRSASVKIDDIRPKRERVERPEISWRLATLDARHRYSRLLTYGRRVVISVTMINLLGLDL